MPSARLAKMALVLSWTLPLQALPATAATPTTAKPKVAARPAGDTRGFLYGKVISRNGTTYQGRLRWEDEEAFWGDLFQADKRDNVYKDTLPERERRKASRIEIFGIPVGVHWDESSGRQLVARFGDIRKIEITGDDEATVHLKSGTRHRIAGGSNDVGQKIVVWDQSLGKIELEWENLKTIEFQPAPANLPVEAYRLHGTVKTRDGSFRGFVQWDQDECLSTDELDGETRDGEVSIPMGNIRSIERRSQNSSQLVLRDGRTLVLTGSNDVNNDNRGVYVDDPRFGRVLVSWDAFERLDFTPPAGSGPAYTDYRPGRPLQGKVTTHEGQTYRGRLVHDLDESETMDFLDGDRNGISYSIPFARLGFLLPERANSSRVVLKDGREIKLEESVDVGKDNAGVLVFEGKEGKARYIPWREVRRIDFEQR